MSLQQCGAQGPHVRILVVVCTDDEDRQRHLPTPTSLCVSNASCTPPADCQDSSFVGGGPASHGCCNPPPCFCEALFI